jgi:hypothetical protein
MITKGRFDMEIKVSETEIGGVLTLPSDWKGYNFNEKTELWVKDSDLYKDEENNLYPFCSVVFTKDIVKTFESSPINENNILIIRGKINDIFAIAYILVGSIDIKNYKFKTKLL